MHICMVAFSDLHFDYRIFRETVSLRQAGHRVSLVAAAFDPAPLPEWEDCQLYLIPIDRTRSLRRTYPLFWSQAFQRLRTLRADVYHAHDLDALWPTARAAQQRGVPLIYDSHEFWTEQSSLVGRPAIRAFWRLLEQRFIGRADRVIAVSESIARALQDRYGLENVAVVRNLPLFRPPEASDLIRTRLGLDADRPIVLYQGGFLTDNGLAEQIRAAAGFGEAAFVLIGDGPSETALRRQVQEAHLEQRVFFIPRVPFRDLHTYTCSADLGLCLIKGTGRSFYYSMPNKLFEYLMAGLPVVASDFPEMQRVITQSGAGKVVDPCDPVAVGRLVRQLLDDTTWLHTCRQAALKAARQFNWEQESHRLLDLYASL